MPLTAVERVVLTDLRDDARALRAEIVRAETRRDFSELPALRRELAFLEAEIANLKARDEELAVMPAPQGLRGY